VVGTDRSLVWNARPSVRAAYGVFNAAIGLTALPASVLAGLLWQGLGAWVGFGPTAPFLFGGCLALLSGLLLWRWVR